MVNPVGRARGNRGGAGVRLPKELAVVLGREADSAAAVATVGAALSTGIAAVVRGARWTRGRAALPGFFLGMRDLSSGYLILLVRREPSTLYDRRRLLANPTPVIPNKSLDPRLGLR